MQPPVIAVLDIGSNAMKYSISEGDGTVLQFERRETTHKGLNSSACLSEDHMAEIVSTAVVMKTRVERFCMALGRPFFMLCVGTQVFRKAKNQDEMGLRFEKTLGMPLHVISSRAEAEFEKLGVETSPTAQQLKHKKIMLVDFGGGSTELSWLFTSTAPFCLPVGKHDFTQDHTFAALQAKFAPVRAYLSDRRPDCILLAGSTAFSYARCLLPSGASSTALEGMPLDYHEIGSQNRASRDVVWTTLLGGSLVRFFQAVCPDAVYLTTYGLRHGIVAAYALGRDVLDRILYGAF